MEMKNDAKVAHLFLIRNGLNHEEIWRRFFYGQDEYFSMYVHAKWPDQLPSEFLRRRLLSRHCETKYATVSLVRAARLLLEEALRDRRNQQFLLHSESCVPIRSFARVYHGLFEIGKSWLSAARGSMYRYAGVNRLAIPLVDFYKSSQFFCLTRTDAEIVVAHNGVEDWENCSCAD